jgi:hypothetical protein
VSIDIDKWLRCSAIKEQFGVINRFKTAHEIGIEPSALTPPYPPAADDFSAAARDLGLTQDDMDACRNPQYAYK